MGGEGSGRPTKEMQIVKRMSGSPANQKGYVIGANAAGDIVMPNYGGISQGAKKAASDPFLTESEITSDFVLKAGDTMTGNLLMSSTNQVQFRNSNQYITSNGLSELSLFHSNAGSTRIYYGTTTNAIFSATGLTIGGGEQNRDYNLTFDGEANDGQFAWFEDEDYFKYQDDILMNTTERIYFRDTSLYIYSSVDGQLDISADVLLQLGSAGNVEFNDAVNIVLGTTTGTKIGTATSQKLSFYNATPIIQPTTSVSGATFTANAGTAVNDASTFDGYTIKQVVKALRNLGLLA